MASVIDQIYCGTVMRSFVQYRRDGYLCDTILVADDGQLKAHSIVLAAASPVFKTALKSSGKPLEHVLVLPGTKVFVLEIALHLAYTGVIIIPKVHFRSGQLQYILTTVKELGLKLPVTPEQSSNVGTKPATTGKETRNAERNSSEVNSVPRSKEISDMNGRKSRKDNIDTLSCSAIEIMDDPVVVNDDDCIDITDEPANIDTVQSYVHEKEHHTETRTSSDLIVTLSNAKSSKSDRPKNLRSLLMNKSADESLRASSDCSGMSKSLDINVMSAVGSSGTAGTLSAANNVPVTLPSVAFETNIETSDVTDGLTNLTSNFPIELMDLQCTSFEVSDLIGDMTVDSTYVFEELPSVGENVTVDCTTTGNVTVPGIDDHCYTTQAAMLGCPSELKYHKSGLKKSKNMRTVLLRKLKSIINSKALNNVPTQHKNPRSTEKPEANPVSSEVVAEDGELQQSAGMWKKPKIRYPTKYQNILCDLCGCEVLSKRFATHYMAHTGHRPYKCNDCGRQFLWRGNLTRHMAWHLGERNYLCQYCGNAYTQKVSLDQHTLNKHRELISSDPDFKPFHCHKCDEHFERRHHLRRHMEVVHGLWAKKFDQNLANENLTTEELSEKPFGCDKCNRQFASSISLENHARCHSGDKPFQCNICGRRLMTGQSLRNHLGTHTLVKPHECLICKRRFRWPRALKAHMFVHKGSAVERPHVCRNCDKSFTSRQQLQIHELIHSGLKPFQCKVCDKRLTQRHHLIRHLQTHSGAKPFKCSDCDKAYSNRYDLRLHCSRVHHYELPLLREYMPNYTRKPASDPETIDCSAADPMEMVECTATDLNSCNTDDDIADASV